MKTSLVLLYYILRTERTTLHALLHSTYNVHNTHTPPPLLLTADENETARDFFLPHEKEEKT